MKTYIISGTNKGLGEAFVSTVLSDTNDLVIAISRRLSENQNSLIGKRFLFLECDLSFENFIDKVKSIKELVTSDEVVFINNAAVINPIAKVGGLDESQIDRLLRVNINSPILLINFILSQFKEKKITMINISSGAAERPIKNWALYCASKASMKMFFEVLKLENPRHRFFNIDPGVMDTDMQLKIRNSHFDDLNQFVKLKEDGLLKSPLEVAKKIISEL